MLDCRCHNNAGQDVSKVVAQYVARMEVLRPDVLRVTRAHKAFRICGQALRPSYTGDLYSESFRSERISCFWSHSWHGRDWMKILSLMMRYNGLPSILVGSVSALIMMGFFSCGLLPRASWRSGGWVGDHGEWSVWSLGGGLATVMITFFLWRPQQLVFLDRICINENDKNLKLACIFSLAGILKRSETMLVLWDSSWTDRLWCLFELAAFLKSKDANEQALLLRPTFLGPCSIVLFVGASIVVLPLVATPIPNVGVQHFELASVYSACVFLIVSGYPIVVAFRMYFRSVETLKVKLHTASFDTARCLCCDLGHMNEDGRPVMCDRQIVKECVCNWFGSQEAFEDCVRSVVLERLVATLQEKTFTRGWSLSVSIPLLWAFFDLIVSHLAGGDRELAIAQFMQVMVLWPLCIPMYADLCISVSRRYCQRGTSTFREILENLKVLFIGVAFFCILAGSWWYFCAQRYHQAIWSSGIFAGVWSAAALCHLAYTQRT